ncbi:MAG: putative O-glycosylation ligase, exosortase A system-associated [Sphingomonadaceae bacterium]
MRDLAFIAFLAALFGIGFRRPFVLVLVYVYIDIVAPQRLTYLLLNNIQISLVAVIAAVGAWAIADDKTHMRTAPRQILMVILLLYCGLTTTQADFPLQAADKWSWVWKALAFAIFLPWTLRTRLRIEALALFMVIAAGSIIVVGGIKTLGSGGGYGVLNLMVTNNTGLYESSIISAVAITIIPLILFLMKHGTVFPPDWRVKAYGAALIFAALLIPVGTQARTGLICIAVLGVLLLRSTKRRFLYLGLVGAAALTITPYLPASFTARMGTIQSYKADQSASTRLAVWAWTWDYVQKNPMGGGFDAFRGNKLRIETQKTQSAGGQVDKSEHVDIDKARAYHSSYFEMLGEQGFFGLFVWLLIHFGGIVRMEIVYRTYRKRAIDDDQWIGALANALQQGHIIYLAGALFVGIAFQPFVYMLVGLQIGLDTYASRRAREAAWRPITAQSLAPA